MVGGVTCWKNRSKTLDRVEDPVLSIDTCEEVETSFLLLPPKKQREPREWVCCISTPSGTSEKCVIYGLGKKRKGVDVLDSQSDVSGTLLRRRGRDAGEEFRLWWMFKK